MSGCSARFDSRKFVKPASGAEKGADRKGGRKQDPDKPHLPDVDRDRRAREHRPPLRRELREDRPPGGSVRPGGLRCCRPYDALHKERSVCPKYVLRALL